ncbi:MAG TPA: hypothetical protein VMB91_12235 [Solirubrobacteraceae bacterium]|nr:hypothetical protein [Solirubrobacteraceae bacterium]
MSRGRVAICALIAMFLFAALAGPAMAKKEYKKEFEASGPEVKLETSKVGTGVYEIILPFEEKGHLAKPYKFKCTELTKATGEIHTTEGKAESFTDKVTLGGCKKGRGKFATLATISPIEFEFHANGTFSILNEPKIQYEEDCYFVLDSGQTVGKEEVEEGKKGPATYMQIGQSAPNGVPQVEVKIKTRTHEEGEEDGLEYEGEGEGCVDQEHKTEGGKMKANFLVHGKSTKENPWIGFKEELLPKEKM